jgi:DNA-binding transcriptional LysR family regulator
MNLNVLRYIIAVYEEGSMTKAARKLFISQSSLSQCIRVLERELGGQLFERTKTTLKPTQIGEHFVYWAKHILESEQKMKQKIAELASSDQRKLAIGISSQKNGHFLRYVLPKFYARAKGCKLIIKEHSSRDLYSLLQRGGVEFIVDQPHPEWTLYHQIPVLTERMLIAAPLSMRFQAADLSCNYPSISISELADKPFILLAGYERYVEFINNLYARIGCSPNIILECVSPEIAYDMVSEQIGVTVISELKLKHSRRPDIHYYTLSDYPLFRLTSVIYPKGRHLSEDAQLFISILREECGKLAALPEEASRGRTVRPSRVSLAGMSTISGI